MAHSPIKRAQTRRRGRGTKNNLRGVAASAGWRGRRARAWAAEERRHRVAGVWTSGDGMNVAKGDFDFCGTCDLNELRVAEIPQRTPACVLPTQVGPNRATDPREDFNSPRKRNPV